VREPLAWFAWQMAQQLDVNDHKDGWGGMSASRLLVRLKQETKELERAIMGTTPMSERRQWERIVEEAADVANFAMMIADNARSLCEPP
jgi:NTP pyrophosphatase (non-canonical NTP hydrolase)